MDHCRAESRASPRSNRYLPSATYTTYAWTGALQLENSLHKSRASREPAWPAALQAYSSSRATWHPCAVGLRAFLAPQEGLSSTVRGTKFASEP